MASVQHTVSNIGLPERMLRGVLTALLLTYLLTSKNEALIDTHYIIMLILLFHSGITTITGWEPGYEIASAIYKRWKKTT